jgi:sugar lactone lactonase YvrE
MPRVKRMKTTIGAIGLMIAALGLPAVSARGQGAASSAAEYKSGKQNTYPNPYRTIANWAKLPEGRKWGSTSAIEVDRAGHIWIAERCGANSCAGSTLNPVLEFDSTGKLLKSFGAGLFIFPHGIYVDKDNNVWVTDAQAADGKGGHKVIKFSSEGKVLLTLGTPGVPGTDTSHFNQPSDVIVAPNGDIFVADGHGGDSNARIVKFDKTGKFLMTWGKKGSAPGEFDIPHGLEFDSQGRLFVADRNNNRIQIFDQQGKFIAEWTQFGRPSGIYIDKNDMLYVADSESNITRHPGWQRGIRIGSAKTGVVTAFIPDPNSDPALATTSAAEGVAVDSKGVIYGAEVGPMDTKKYVKN